MRKYFPLVILFTILQLNLFAQDRGYISLSLGPSFPVGDFGSTDINNENSGFANVGTITDFSFAYKFGKNIGITSIIRWQSNKLDVDAILSAAKLIDPTIKWTATSDNWKLSGIMIGMYGSFPIAKSNTCFELRAMLGPAWATLPHYSLTGTSGGVSLTNQVNSQSTSTISFLVGAGLRFNVGKKVSILTNVDYSSATAEFLHATATTNNFSSSSNFDIKQDMKTINVGIGIGLRL